MQSQYDKKSDFNPWASVEPFVTSREPKHKQSWAKDAVKYASASERVKRRVLEECALCGPKLRYYAASEPGPARKGALLSADCCVSDALQRSELNLGSCAKLKRKWFSTSFSLMDGDAKLAAALLDRCTSSVLGKETKQELIDRFAP